MRAWIGVAMVCVACDEPAENPQNPSYPPPVFPREVRVTEGGSTTFQVGLTGGPQPDQPARPGPNLMFWSSDDSAPKLRFEFSGWLSTPDDYPVDVTAIAMTDEDTQNERVDLHWYFNGDLASYDFTVHILDTDAQAAISNIWLLTLPTGGSAEFAVRLTQPPTESVIVNLGSDLGEHLTATPASLVFGPTDYYVYQPVVVSGPAASGHIFLTPNNGVPQTVVEVIPPFNDYSQ